MGFLDPVLDPLLSLGAFWAIFIIALLAALITTLVTKYATNQEEMKRLKEQTKDFQKQIKENKGNNEKVLEIQKQAMQTNMQYMKHSFRVTLFTMLPFLLLLWWMQSNLEYTPLMPGDVFKINVELVNEGNLTAEVSKGLLLVKQDGANFTVKAMNGGNQFIDIKHGGETYTKEVLVSSKSYSEPVKIFENKSVKAIVIKYEKLRPLGDTSLFGWKPGWLGIYIILSIIFSMGLRKVVKVY